MRTIRTILATLAVILITYGLVAMSAVNNKAAFAEYSLYAIFSPSNFVALVLGVAFLLVAILLTVAVVSFKDKNRVFDEDEEEDEEEEEDDEEALAPPPTPARRVAPPPYVPRTSDRERALVKEEEAMTRRMPPVRNASFGAPAQFNAPMPDRAAEHAFERPAAPVAAPAPSAPTPAKVPAFCPNCGEPLSGPTQYCPACGKKVMRAD
ncbi:MAG: zinc ribbon domain-containing protein [Clostridiales bacterium]|nr:zinc ribbon domain-containing protein [Clostridiales bacterium]